jgi:Rad3-related DNA helicase
VGWKPDDPGSITWFNCEAHALEPRWEFKTAPLAAGPVFQGLAAAKESVVLTSATLSVAGSFDYVKQCLGFSEELAQKTDWLQLDSPFNYAEQSLLLVASDMANPSGSERDQYMKQLEDVVLGVEKLFERGVLVLFNSYRDLNQIAGRIAPFMDASRLLVQGLSGSRGEIAERFRREGDKVLLATRSFWEGFDVVGDALSCVVLAKLPFANFKDPVHAGRQRAIDERGGDSFNEYSLPLAATLLKQGFGRLIRSQKDYGCVFLLDSRAVNSRYGRVFIDSLPGPRLYSGRYEDCLKEAKKFMAAKKD